MEIDKIIKLNILKTKDNKIYRLEELTEEEQNTLKTLIPLSEITKQQQKDRTETERRIIHKIKKRTLMTDLKPDKLGRYTIDNLKILPNEIKKVKQTIYNAGMDMGFKPTTNEIIKRMENYGMKEYRTRAILKLLKKTGMVSVTLDKSDGVTELFSLGQ